MNTLPEWAPQARELDHLLVPTNFGQASRAARRAAIRWAVGGRARVTLLHVSPETAAPAGLDATLLLHAAACRQGVEHYLEELAGFSAEHDLHPELKEFVDVRSEHRQGAVVDEIVRFAREEAVDAIVLGARRWWLPWDPPLGRTLAKKSGCEVLLVYPPPSGTVRTIPRLLAQAAEFLADRRRPWRKRHWPGNAESWRLAE